MQQENKILRTGPRPLWLHLQNAILVAAQQQDNAFFQKYLEGVNKYFHFQAIKEEKNSYHILWEKDDVRVYIPKSYAQKPLKKAMLLIPSLINDHRIFDLCDESSYFSYLAENQICPLLIDWGSPHHSNKKTLDCYIEHYLEPIIDEFLETVEELFALGYCMGGLMLMATDTPARTELKRIFMATPWDFSKMHSDAQNAAQAIWHLNRFSEGFLEYLPIDMVQSFFAMIDKENTVKKFTGFCTLEDVRRQRLFVAVEDWLNHGKPVSYQVFKTCIEEWYIQNKPAQNDWLYKGNAVSGKTQKASQSLFVIPKKDKLVAPDSALALFKEFKQADLIEPDTGHIGLMGSMNAKEKVWQPILKWMKSIEK